MSLADLLSESMADLVEVSDEALLNFLKTDQGKKKAANAIYASKHKDFRGKNDDGERSVLYNAGSGGTQSWPIDGASAETLLKLLKADPKAVAKLKLGEETEPTEAELEDEYTAMISALSEETGEPLSLLEAMNGKISTFLTVFSSMLTQYDQLLIKNETKRGGRGNIYRLSLWFEALDKVKQRVSSMLGDDSTDAIKALRAAVDKEFTSGNPADKFRKAMDAYIEKGTLPKIPISKEVKAQVQAEKKAAKEAAARAKAEKVQGGPEKLVAGQGRPGQKFDYGGVTISTTLHDIGGKNEDIERLDELGGGRYSGGGRGGDPRWMEAKYAGQAKDGTSFRKGERVLYFPNTKSFFVGKQAEKEWKDFLSANGDEEGMPYAESRLDEVFGKGDYDGEANAIQGFIAKHEKKGAWSLLIYPMKSKWRYSTTNPQGGGGGSIEASVKTAFAAGSRIGGKFADLKGDEMLHVAILQRSGKVKTFETPVASPKLTEGFDSSALSGQLEEALSEPLHEEQTAHHHYDGKNWYVDTGFVSASEKAMPGFSLSHMGMGEFSLKGPDGEIEFDRMRGKDFPGQVGRSHKLYDNKDGALIKKLIAAMKGKSQEMKAESLGEAADRMVRFPEGTMSEKDWVSRYADSIEAYNASPDFDRRAFNNMNSDEQKAYDKKLEKQAAKTVYRAWQGDTFYRISKNTYFLAKDRGVKQRTKESSLGEANLSSSSSYQEIKKEAGKWAKSFAADLMKKIRPKPKSIAVVNPDMGKPMASWDYRIHSKLDITLASGETLSAFVSMNVSDGECSGNVTLDDKWGGTMATARRETRDQATWVLVDELATHLSRGERNESLDEAQRGAAGLAFDDEDAATKPGAFKISSKAMAIYKGALGDQWEGPESTVFKRYHGVITGLSQQDLLDLFDAERMDLAQDMIASKPKAAFNKWLARTAKVSPALGKLVRARPDWSSILFYMTVMRVSGRDMADIILKRYFETETDHIGAVKAKMKVEDLEEAIRSSRDSSFG